jgi:hypothetical protein
MTAQSQALNANTDYPETIMDLLPDGTKLTPEQTQIMHLIQGHVTLQNQFEQLTKHVESIYSKIATIERTVANKILS